MRYLCFMLVSLRKKVAIIHGQAMVGASHNFCIIPTTMHHWISRKIAIKVETPPGPPWFWNSLFNLTLRPCMVAIIALEVWDFSDSSQRMSANKKESNLCSWHQETLPNSVQRGRIPRSSKVHSTLMMTPSPSQFFRIFNRWWTQMPRRQRWSGLKLIKINFPNQYFNQLELIKILTNLWFSKLLMILKNSHHAQNIWRLLILISVARRSISNFQFPQSSTTKFPQMSNIFLALCFELFWFFKTRIQSFKYFLIFSIFFKLIN